MSATLKKCICKCFNGRISRRLTTAMSLLFTVIIGAAPGEEQNAPLPKYEPTWESLDQHQTPEWFMDAKLGLMIYSPAPTKAEWDRWWDRHGGSQYVESRHISNSREYRFASNAWDNGEWDAEDLAQLAHGMGAEYVVFASKAHGYFANYLSVYSDVPGSPFMKIGPAGRDYTAELAQAVRARDMHFCLYFNYIRPEKCPYWLEMKYELIDRFQPSSIWLDGDKLSFPANVLKSRELLAYYYNRSANPEGVACEDALGAYKKPTWGKRRVHGDWYRREAAHADVAQEISDGYYVRYEEVFRGGNRAPHGRSRGRSKNLIDWLIHVTSHGGNLDLAIFVNRDYGTQKRALLQLGDWLEVNGEAIYGTRPWPDGRPHGKTAEGVNVEFTTKGESLYAILLDWPQRETLLPHLQVTPETTIHLLGVDTELTWKQTDRGLHIHLPPWWENGVEKFGPEIPCDHAYSLRISPKPQWVD